MIRIVLADDQTLMRAGLRGLLELTPDLRVAAEAADGREAIAAVRAERPDVLLLDVRMPHASGLDVLRELGRTGELPPTLLLTTFDDDEALFAALRSGARGFLLKDVSFERLTEAIRAVARGETLIRPAVTERVVSLLERTAPAFESLERADPLTPREIDVLRLMAGGYSNREIATALGTSEGTVKNQVSSILSKLGVRDRTRAVLRGIELGQV